MKRFQRAPTSRAGESPGCGDHTPAVTPGEGGAEREIDLRRERERHIVRQQFVPAQPDQQDKLRVDGIEVEIMGDIQKRLRDGGWDEPPDLVKCTEYLLVDGMRVPVLTVEHEYEAYLRFGRTERARLLRAWLDGTRG